MAKTKKKEVQRIQDDIDDIVENLSPDVCARWFGYKPASSSTRIDNYSPMSSPHKQAKGSSRKPPKRKADENQPDAGHDSDSSIEFVSKSSKKPKHSLPEDDSNTNDSVEMSVYLYVETPPPPALNVRKRATRPPPTQTTELGPYIFNSSINYTDFLRILADGCCTKTANLAIDTLQWKFDRPGNAQKKVLSTKTAFDVMIQSLKDRHKDYVFSVYMRSPLPVKKELPWTQEAENVGGKALDFEYNVENAVPNSVKSIREQIVSIDTASNKELNELLEAYPIDNHPHFAGKRIYHNEVGFFDLTDIKLRVWAVAMANGTAMIDKPPASNHFFKNQTIHPPPRASGLPTAPALIQLPIQPPENPQNQLLQLLLGQPNLLQLLNPYPQPLPNPYGAYMPNPFPMPPHVLGPPPPVPPQAVESPTIELPREITLDEYCERYKLSADDHRVLSELGYVPGDDGIKELDTAMWEVTRVLPLAKARILRQHAAFLKDVTNGLWV
ncbi:hypothetical protein B0H13DRAFT_2365161 [Mycena leptocephala]|nr:hypothetical protein B0H13DRAFT_2365161 [Mycena leptocephala]